MTKTDIVTLWRADIYRILALCLDFPSPMNQRSIDHFVAGVLENTDSAMLKPWLSELQAQVKRASIDAWSVEFNRMFVNEVFVPPSEGSYCLAERGALVGDICGFYKAFHVQVEEQAGPPDQIKIELGFMCVLALKEVNAVHSAPDKVDITRAAAKSFFEDHLGRWLPKFVDRLSASSNFPVYRALTGLLTSWHKQECDHWNVTPTVYPDTLRSSDGEKMQCPFADQCLQ